MTGVFIDTVVIEYRAYGESITVGGERNAPTRVVLSGFSVNVDTFLDPRLFGRGSIEHSHTSGVETVYTIVKNATDSQCQTVVAETRRPPEYILILLSVDDLASRCYDILVGSFFDRAEYAWVYSVFRTNLKSR